MHIGDVGFVLQWWVMLFLIGLVFQPLVHRFFANFFDRGYIFAKTLGVIVTTYLLFLLGVMHLLPFTQTTILIVLAVLFLVFHVSTISFTRGAIKLHTNYFLSLWKHKNIIIIEEILLLIVLFFWAYIRGFAPEIHGLEKYMDFGFVNSAIRSMYFPPLDMWLTPETINYYYFGHLITAVLTKLSGIPSFITYNLMLATLAALCFVSSFSLAINLYYALYQKIGGLSVKSIAAGILSGLLVTFGGNLHILYAFFTPYENEHPVPIWQQVFQPLAFPNGYWYPNATRFIENTIHEFPIYSWVVSDLHGHVLDIPIVLLTLAVVFALLQYFLKTSAMQNKLEPVVNKSFSQSLLLPVRYLLFAGFLLSVMYMTNAWDGVIYFLLFGLLLLFFSWKVENPLFSLPKRLIHTLIRTIPSVTLIAIAYFLFSLPFSLFFNPASIVSGIGVLCAPKFLTDIGTFGPFLFEANHCSQSPLWQMVMLYGFFLFFAVSLLVFLRKRHNETPADTFALMLMLLSLLLIVIPEFIYVKDIYPAHYRANTMFKLVFQSFMMLALVSGYTLMRILTTYATTMSNRTIRAKILFSGWFCISFFLIVAVMLYPYLAVHSYYGELKAYKGLNGIQYLKDQYPTDFAAIAWLQDNVDNQPVILEAQGDSYTDFARVSANTGLPTVLGWTVHEWLWRGTYDIPAPRIAEVQTMYESANADEANVLLKKYKVEYVFIGDLEYQKYPNLNEQKFQTLGEKVYENGKTKIYKMNN